MLSRLALCVFLTSIVLSAESVRINGPSQFPFPKNDVHRKVLEEGDDLFRAFGPAPPRLGKQIPQVERERWKVDCTSKLTKHDCVKVKDGKNNTFWQSNVTRESIDVLPHNITIDLGEVKNVNALSMRPLPDADLGGAVAGHKLYISMDRKRWKLVAFGTWFDDIHGELLVISSMMSKQVD